MIDLTILDKMRNKDGDQLFQYQKDAVRQMVNRRHTLLADEPGLGKSAQAIALWEVIGARKILVVTKASLKRGFLKHIEHWQYARRVIQIIDKKTDIIDEFAEIVIVNYDLIIHSFIFHQLTERRWDLFICDEAHALKNKDSKRTVAALAKGGLAHCANRSLMMTGTPVLNRPIELYPILKTFAPLVLGKYNDYWKYGKRYCDGWQDGFAFNVTGASHTDELNKNLRQYYMIRRSYDEVEIQLPKKRYEMVFIDSSKDVQTKLRILDNADRKDFKHQELDVDGGGLATLRRETAELKINVTIDLIKEYVETAGKIVIFAYHHSVIERLEKELAQFNATVLHGGCSQDQRTNSIRKFQTEKDCKVFIGQIRAAGEGIDELQEVCHNVLFVEWSWVPGEIEQACKRVHRIGQTKPVLIRFLVWADSVEEHQMRVALDKVKTIKEILK